MSSALERGREWIAQAPEMGGAYIRQIVDAAIDGIAGIPGAKTTAAQALQKAGHHEKAISSLISSHTALGGAQGMLTSIGGVFTVVASIPANIVGLVAIQARLVASIAHLRGYDLDERRVRTAVGVCLLGSLDVNRLIAAGKLPSTPLGIATAPMFDVALDKDVHERVAGSLLTRSGGRSAVVVAVKRVPLVGGGVGLVADGWSTYDIGNYARTQFLSRRVVRDFPPDE